jgi:uncharacterized protein related to proFAR isomerase
MSSNPDGVAAHTALEHPVLVGRGVEGQSSPEPERTLSVAGCRIGTILFVVEEKVVIGTT